MMTATLELAADVTVNSRLTAALQDWLAADDRLERFADETLAEDDCTIDPQVLADWTEDAIREDADDLTGAVLLAACRLADWRELAGFAEEALEL